MISTRTRRAALPGPPAFAQRRARLPDPDVIRATASTHQRVYVYGHTREEAHERCQHGRSCSEGMA